MTASHHELDLESLEQLTRGTHAMGKSIVTDCARINGSVVLSTCNRFEVYLDVDLDSSAHSLERPDDKYVEHAVSGVAQLISYAANVEPARARHAFTVRTGEDVVTHLFKVASGLDSLVVGEREIAGQVRKSLQSAHADQVTTGSLERLFQRALRTSKNIASQTQLSADGRSVVSVALKLAEPTLPDWGSVSALVVGTGAYAGATVAALRAHGVRDISVYSGSGRAEAFADSHQVVPVFELTEGVADADLILCCSGTGGRAGKSLIVDDTLGVVPAREEEPHSTVSYVLDAASIVAARQARTEQAAGLEGAQRRQVVVDLALHRDADPRIADMDSVLLIDLSTVRANVPDIGEDTVGHAELVLHESVEEYVELEKLRAADVVITRLVESFNQAKTQQILELVRDGFTEEDAKVRVNKAVNPEMHKLIMKVRSSFLR